MPLDKALERACPITRWCVTSRALSETSSCVLGVWGDSGSGSLRHTVPVPSSLVPGAGTPTPVSSTATLLLRFRYTGPDPGAASAPAVVDLISLTDTAEQRTRLALTYHPATEELVLSQSERAPEAKAWSEVWKISAKGFTPYPYGQSLVGVIFDATAGVATIADTSGVLVTKAGLPLSRFDPWVEQKVYVGDAVQEAGAGSPSSIYFSDAAVVNVALSPEFVSSLTFYNFSDALVNTQHPAYADFEAEIAQGGNLEPYEGVLFAWEAAPSEAEPAKAAKVATVLKDLSGHQQDAAVPESVIDRNNGSVCLRGDASVSTVAIPLAGELRGPVSLQIRVKVEPRPVDDDPSAVAVPVEIGEGGNGDVYKPEAAPITITVPTVVGLQDVSPMKRGSTNTTLVDAPLPAEEARGTFTPCVLASLGGIEIRLTADGEIQVASADGFSDVWKTGVRLQASAETDLILALPARLVGSDDGGFGQGQAQPRIALLYVDGRASALSTRVQAPESLGSLALLPRSGVDTIVEFNAARVFSERLHQRAVDVLRRTNKADRLPTLVTNRVWMLDFGGAFQLFPEELFKPGEHRVEVTACNSVGWGPSAVTLFSVSERAPEAPTSGWVSSITSTGVELSWQPALSQQATEYTVEYAPYPTLLVPAPPSSTAAASASSPASAAPAPTKFKSATVSGRLSCELTGLRPNSRYLFKVWARGRGGTSSSALELQASTLPSAPQPPQLSLSRDIVGRVLAMCTVAGTADTVTLTWSVDAEGAEVKGTHAVAVPASLTPSPTTVVDLSAKGTLPADCYFSAVVTNKAGSSAPTAPQIPQLVKEAVVLLGPALPPFHISQGTVDVAAATGGALVVDKRGTLEFLSSAPDAGRGSTSVAAMSSSLVSAAKAPKHLSELCETGVVRAAACGGALLFLTRAGLLFSMRDGVKEKRGGAACRSFAVGPTHAAAVFGSDQVTTWGHISGAPATITLKGKGGVSAVACGDSHFLALTSSGGEVYAWGTGSQGQLGVPGATSAPFPLLVRGLPPVQAIAAARHTSIALTESGAVYLWGRSLLPTGQRQLLEPEQVDLPERAVQVSAAASHLAVLLESGDVHLLGEPRGAYPGRLDLAGARVISVSAGWDGSTALLMAYSLTGRFFYGVGEGETPRQHPLASSALACTEPGKALKSAERILLVELSGLTDPGPFAIETPSGVVVHREPASETRSSATPASLLVPLFGCVASDLVVTVACKRRMFFVHPTDPLPLDSGAVDAPPAVSPPTALLVRKLNGKLCVMWPHVPGATGYHLSSWTPTSAAVATRGRFGYSAAVRVTVDPEGPDALTESEAKEESAALSLKIAEHEAILEQIGPAVTEAAKRPLPEDALEADIHSRNPLLRARAALDVVERAKQRQKWLADTAETIASRTKKDDIIMACSRQLYVPGTTTISQDHYYAAGPPTWWYARVKE